MTRRSVSLSLRLLAGAGLWLALGLGLGGYVLATQITSFATSIFDQELAEQTRTLQAAVEFAPDGTPILSVLSARQRYQTPFSGWYWQVNDDVKVRLRSRSLWDDALEIDLEKSSARGTFFEIIGPSGKALRGRTTITQYENGGRLHFTVAGDTKQLSSLRSEVTSFLLITVPLLLGLLLLGILLQIRFGLQPLRRIQNELREVREGSRELLSSNYPRELDPMAAEINMLQQTNIGLIERARKHVGNLAHALKTPLAVLRNDAFNAQSKLALTTRDQVDSMQEQIDRYLALARSAAASQVRGRKVEMEPLVTSLAGTIEQIYQDKPVSVAVDLPKGSQFRGDKADLTEVLGNLLDNAAKWCTSKTQLTAVWQQRNLIIDIDDDGPGIPADKRQRALSRGQRLDEQTPGSGLGLSIVKDMVDAYGGNIDLQQSELGGLKVRLMFPNQL